MQEKLKIFREKISELKKLEGALAILNWDLETCTPPKGQEFLASIVGMISMQEYNLTTSDEFTNLVNELKENEDKLNDIEKKEIELIVKDMEKKKNIPSSEYKEYSELVVVAQGIWEQAKKANDYEMFKPYLQKIFDFNIKFAKYNRKDEENLYDVLLNDYEKGMTTKKLDVFFDGLKKEIVPLLQKIMAKGKTKNLLNINVEIEKQREISDFLSRYLGFDFSRGVARESEHPFTMDLNRNDVRITTNYKLDEPMSAIFSTIHETGHGIYEQQIDKILDGTLVAGGGSMGIHESQSRFYENMIGRSIGFWKGIKNIDPKKLDFLKDINMPTFYKQINIATPSLIRTEADELTYSLHILIRYEIEKGIIEGKINAQMLPKIWNELMEKYLGISVPNDSLGVMQDVHWACGLIGYFPSYALGSAYAAQIYHKMNEDMDIEKVLENGEMEKIKLWLGQHIHKYGKLKDTEEIIKAITNEELNSKYYIDYLKNKFSKIYMLDE